MFVIVTPDGRYHGHTATPEALGSIADLRKNNARQISTEEWSLIASTADMAQRASLCAAAGTKL